MAGTGVAPRGAAYPRIDVADVQGVALRGYGNLRAARFVLFSIVDRAATRRWLGSLLEREVITPASPGKLDRAVNIAFTRSGFEQLGLPKSTLSLFSREFCEGMSTRERSSMLGDTGSSAPASWHWGHPYQSKTDEDSSGRDRQQLDGVLMLYATERGATVLPERLETYEAIKELCAIDTLRPDGFEHFGFRDGLVQPHLRNANAPCDVSGVLRPGPDSNAVNAGEMLLGYLDEFGCYEPSPLLSFYDDPRRLLTRGEDGYPDFGKNGTYLAVRQLQQDVFAFWKWAADARFGDPVSLAAKLVGRWPSGAPLTLHPDHDPGPEAAKENDFGYSVEDAFGHRCPIGAHTRRANPRDSLEPSDPSFLIGPKDPFARPTRIANRHRVIRRGRPYGAHVHPETLKSMMRGERATDDGVERGLLFVAAMASLRRQFEFVQSTWCNDPGFRGLVDEPDPIIAGGVGAEGSSFTVQAHVPTRLSGIRRFVVVRGGAYFFLPSLRALRYLAATSAG